MNMCSRCTCLPIHDLFVERRPQKRQFLLVEPRRKNFSPSVILLTTNTNILLYSVNSVNTRDVEAIDRFQFGEMDSYKHLNHKMEAEAEAESEAVEAA